MPQLFISYAREDKADARFVRGLIDQMSRPQTSQEKAALVVATVVLSGAWAAIRKGRQPGFSEVQYTTWMDEDIVAGADWNAQIEQAIRQSAGIVVLVPTAISPGVAIECGIALAQKKSVIPIVRSANDLTAYQLGRYQALPWPENNAAWINKLRASVIEVK